MSTTRISLIISFLIGLSSFNISAQNTLTGSEVPLQKNLNDLSSILDDYEVYKIDIVKDKVNISSATPFLDLDLGKKSFKLNLFNDNLSVSYNKNISNQPLLLGGSLRSGGTVSLTINDGFIYGFIKTGKSHYFIEPLSYLSPGADPSYFILYNADDVKEDKEHVCGVTETIKQHQKFTPRKTITTCKLIDLAIANTFDMVTKYVTTVATENHNLAVLNNVQTNYRSEFDDNIEFNVVAHYFPSSASNNPLEPLTTTNDASTLLGNFRTWTEDTGSCSGSPCFNICAGGDCGGATGGFGIDFTIGTLWTDRDITFGGSSGTVGLAYTPGWHHLLEDYTTSAASLMAMVSHEVGHNFSANHDASGSNFIMAPSVTLTDNWSAASKTSVNNRLTGQTYLNNCSTLGAPTANFFKSATAVCSGSTIEFEDQSQYGATRSWSFPGGTPSTSVDEKPSVTYSTPGIYTVELTSTNATGSDTYLDYVDIEVTPPTPCTPTGGSGGSGGITLVRIENLSKASTTAGLYDDNACTDVASLEPGTSYTLTVGVSGVTRLRYFIDYNGDGDFLDTNESSGNFSFSGTGNLNVGLNTPSSPVLETLLRMRVIVGTSTIASSGCVAPTTGQVEDYSFYFPVTQVFGCTDPAASNYNPNATIDDGSCTTGGVVWFADTDNDNFGDAANTTVAASAPAGYVADNTDCDDTDATVFPGAPELCDGQDNDCDGQIDEGVLNTYYQDSDGDNFGNSNVSTTGCSAPAGYVTNDTDCDDTDPNNYPGNTEVCDGQDNDCDGQIDEGLLNTYYQDSDGDNFGNSNVSTTACSTPAGYVTNDTDCDDTDPNNYPGNTEVCDGQDNDCDGQIDEGVLNTYYQDSDGDNFGNSNVSTTACSTPAGYVTNDTDCDDTDPNNYPGNTEVCDGQDNDCDGQIDEGVLNTYYQDSDGDNFGNSNVSTTACSTPAGYVTNDTDCDDTDPNNYPGNTEVCDGQDNDCDGQIDEGVLNTYYQDSDGDNFGNSNVSTTACSTPAGYVTNDTDCDDTDPNNYPGNTEVCDGQDNDCDGITDEGCGDCDGSYLIINTITQNTYKAVVKIESNTLISGSSNVLFTAGTEIELLPGFEVVIGSDFEAKIEPCTPSSPDPVVANNGLLGTGSTIMQAFGNETEIEVVITNNKNHTSSKTIKAKDISVFISKQAFDLEKGAYKLIVRSADKETTQDILVIK